VAVVAFIIRRVFWALFLFLTTTLLAYLIFFVLPADPAKLIAGRNASPADVARVARFYHFNVSIWQRYWIFLWNLVRHGSFGNSYVSRQPVRALIAADAPVTGSLVAGAAVLWLLVSIPVGVLSAIRPRSVLDRTSTGFVLFGISTHPVVLGLVLSYVFGYRLHLTPIAGYCNFFPGDSAATCDGPVHWAYHLILPWVTFMVLFAALYVRLIRASVLEALSEDYVRTARAKGAPERRVLTHHVLRNCLLPVVTILGMDIGVALGGAMFTEEVFELPGLGREILHAYAAFDLPIVAGLITFITVTVIAFNFVVDVAYGIIDPRIRTS
jgi:peptide/nickel transport system permease protein